MPKVVQCSGKNPSVQRVCHCPSAVPPPLCWYEYGGRDKAEYIYWLVTTWLGCHADPARAAMIGEEWKLSTRQQLLEGTEECPSGDALGVALLQDPRFRLPTRKLPDGKYLGPR